MKKLYLCLLLTLTLTACGASNSGQGGSQTPEPGGQTEPAGISGTAQTETEATQDAVTSDDDRKPTAEELGRSETTDLTFFVEGQEETVPAALYIGQGYSLYLPAEGWERESFTENGAAADSWESTDNDAVELRILHLGERTLDECYDWIIREMDDYVISEDKQGGLYGENRENGMVLEVRFHPGDAGMYAVAWAYPLEAAEGFGTRLNVLADTFEVMP